VAVLRQDALVSADTELGFEHLERLGADPALDLSDHSERRIARHHPRQQEVQRERNPEGQHEETYAPKHVSHVPLLTLIVSSNGPPPVRASQGPAACAAAWDLAGQVAAGCGARPQRRAPRRGADSSYFLTGTRCSIVCPQSG